MERSFPQDFDSLTFLYYSIWCKKSSSCVMGLLQQIDSERIEKNRRTKKVLLLCMNLYFSRMVLYSTGSKIQRCKSSPMSFRMTTFPNVFRAIQQKLQPDTILWCKGRLSVQESGVSLLCSSVLTLEELQKQLSRAKFCIKLSSTDTDRMQQAIQIAAKYSGETALCFYLTDQKKMIQPKQKQSIAISAESEQAFSAIFTSSELGILQV